MSPLRKTRESDARKPSQGEVASAVGITQAFYHRLETGDRDASLDLAMKLADYFCVPVTEIFTPARFSSDPEAA